MADPGKLAAGALNDEGPDTSTLRTRSSRSRSSSQRARNALSQLGLTRHDSSESSKALNKQLATPKQPPSEDYATPSPAGSDVLNIEKRQNGHIKDGPRTRRNRTGGGFLLSNSLQPDFLDRRLSSAPTSRKESSPRDFKGKAPLRVQEQKLKKKTHGLGIGATPLIGNTESANAAHNEASLGGDAAADTTATSSISTQAPLDEESAQIVSLALNLSENRRNSRRNISSPLPAALPLGESLAGASLRQHLQQQRRVSRNISPIPGLHRMSLVERTGGSPRRSVFGPHHDAEYRYNFSASTMARVEKARKYIELMAEYRRLLQYLPPLKPQAPSRVSTAATGDLDRSSSAPGSSGGRPTSSQVQALGRPYNPLQYIRNRKVRARERKAIDGEAQGFGDISAVSAWVDEISGAHLHEDYQTDNHVYLPSFSAAADEAAIHASPNSRKGQVAVPQVKRPRIDWSINPADMLADVYWLEQDYNKTLIEDHFGRKIFPPGLQRPTSRKTEERNSKELSEGHTESLIVDINHESELPHFKSIKHDSERHLEKLRGRTKQKLRDATHFRHGHHSAGHEHHFWRSHSRSDSDTSDSDRARYASRHRRSMTMDSQVDADILEKQMLQMLAKEATQNGWRADDPHTQSQAPSLDRKSRSHENSAGPSSSRSRQASVERRATRDSKHTESPPTSARASLEVPRLFGRRSFEGKDMTAPSSPEIGPPRNGFFDFGTMDSPPPSRRASPTRNPLHGVRSKISALRDKDRGRDPTAMDVDGNMSAEFSDQVSSPTTKLRSRRTDETSKSSKPSGIRRKLEKESFEIKELFKSGKSNIEDIVRSPVSKVGLWRRRDSSSDTSSDESDSSGKKKGRIPRIQTELEAVEPKPSEIPKPKSYFYELPVFKSTLVADGDAGTTDSEAKAARKSRFDRLKPPRIDVHSASPSSSTEMLAVASDVSDVESTRGSSLTRLTTMDKRIEDLLAHPGGLGRGRNALPMTGLSKLDGHAERPGLAGKRQWSISDARSPQRTPGNRREIARTQALLLSSGIKAKEIARRAAEPHKLLESEKPLYADIAKLSKDPLPPVKKSQEHVLSAKIISSDLQLSSQLWQQTADKFCKETVDQLHKRIEAAQVRISTSLTPLTRKAADDADNVSRRIVLEDTLALKKVADSMETMLRRRRRKFRWVRRAGWLLVEWALVGIMWWVWMIVVLLRVVRGICGGVVGTVKWLLWLR